MKGEYGIYQVAFKILLRKENQVLFLKDAEGKHWDWPGGRIDKGEENIPLKKVLKREVEEELGNITYKLEGPLFQYRRYFDPHDIYILITVYDAEYISGEIKLSSEHKSSHWIDPRNFRFNASDFWHPEEYEAFMEYLKEI
jgi:8-oxo-dGTP pyrophosphatase MutT (NUDIX family)